MFVSPQTTNLQKWIYLHTPSCSRINHIMPNQALIARIEQSLDTIRPHLQADGGDIEVLDITDDHTVLVRLLGACQNCPMSFMTLKAGIEQTLKAVMPTIKGVKAIEEYVAVP